MRGIALLIFFGSWAAAVLISWAHSRVIKVRDERLRQSIERTSVTRITRAGGRS